LRFESQAQLPRLSVISDVSEKMEKVARKKKVALVAMPSLSIKVDGFKIVI